MKTFSSLHRRLLVGALLVSSLAAQLAFARPVSAAEGLRVSGTKVVESNGNNFIMRGVNHEHAWFTSHTSAFADIKSFNSNVVRVVLTGGRWGNDGPSDVANVVSLCKTNRMICVLEDHDTTGYGEDGAAYTLDQAVSYFATLQSVLTGQEDYVIINPGNEPIGNNNPAQWVSATTNAIIRLRNLGFQHLIMVDAPNWGQDWQYVMQASAQQVFDADPNKNLVFSIHMYGVFNTASSITSYLDFFASAGLPLVIGEFGYNNNNSANVDSETVLSQAQSRGIGYIGWSWCGNNDPYLDMATNWDKNNLSPWGQRILNGPNGIVATAKEATIFGLGSTYGLTVTMAGSGSGTVSGGGINCGSACTGSYASGTTVTLTATAASGSSFAGWSGDCAGTSSTCSVSMTAARTVTATFSVVPTNYTLTVSKAGSGSGTVTSNTGGISCGSACSASYTSGTTVTLTAAAASGSTFASWSGCTSSSGATCTVSMTAAQAVTATFNPTGTSYALTVSMAGSGSGTVTSTTGGISCGSTCSASYTSGTTVTLTAAAASGSTFASWSGCTSSSGASCIVSMTTAKTVTATFNALSTSYALTVSRAGSGTGTVTSSTGGINCGSTCSASYTSGTTVTLTAAAASGSTFASWSGCTSSSGATCTVSMTAAQTVTATFNTSTGTTPCANPVTFTGNTNNFNTTGSVCYRTAQAINGWGCYNFDGRTVSVNNTAVTCGQMPLPAKWSDGYTYFSVTAGTYSWAGLYTW